MREQDIQESYEKVEEKESTQKRKVLNDKNERNGLSNPKKGAKGWTKD